MRFVNQLESAAGADDDGINEVGSTDPGAAATVIPEDITVLTL